MLPNTHNDVKLLTLVFQLQDCLDQQLVGYS